MHTMQKLLQRQVQIWREEDYVITVIWQTIIIIQNMSITEMLSKRNVYNMLEKERNILDKNNSSLKLFLIL